jgi:flagellar motor protein MotB
MKQLLILALTFSGMQGLAQHKAIYLKAADSYYKNEDYYSATLYYEKYLASGAQRNVNYSPYAGKSADVKYTGSEQQAVYLLADSYRRLNDPAKAAPYYQQALTYDNNHFPLTAYYYGVSLRALQKYDSASIIFEHFLQAYGTKDAYRASAEKELRNLQFIKVQLQRNDSGEYHVNKFSSAINGEGATYAPALINGNLVYTATPNNINRIFTGNREAFPIAASPKLHQGTVSLTADGQGMYLTQWSVNNGKKSAAIYYSHYQKDGWSEPVKLDTIVNKPGFNTQQPFINGNTLYFSSDRAGGFGGFDLYIAKLEGDHITSVQNAGSVINTTEDEQAPYYFAAEQTLVFASNGRVGMGGYDLYYAKGNVNKWEEPVNFGYPVNDVKDDIYFLSKGTGLLDDVIFCSDRSAQCCLEMFSLQKEKKAVAVVKIDTIKSIPASLPVNTPIPINHIYYEVNQYTVTPESYAALDELVAMLEAHPNMEVEISAHTDNVGTAVYNQQLSEKRAQNCVDYLVKKGIAASRLQYKGYGDTKPVSTNDTPEGRQLNRRIELKILKQ